MLNHIAFIMCYIEHHETCTSPFLQTAVRFKAIKESQLKSHDLMNYYHGNYPLM